MFCAKCGAEVSDVPDDSSFCGYCGAPLAATVDDPIEAEESTVSEPEADWTPPAAQAQLPVAQPSFFGTVFWLTMAISGVLRWPIALVYPAGIVLYALDGNIGGLILWVVILGPLATIIIEFLVLIPFFLFSLVFAGVLTVLRELFRFETGLLKRLPIEVRRRDKPNE